MKLEPPAPESSKPLVCILDEGTNLDEWLATHPPHRLGVPAAFNNGNQAEPLWVLAVKSMDQIAELADVTAEPVFTKAHTLMKQEAEKVLKIQADEDIPVRATGKGAGKSKKQCRTEVQEAFHSELMQMAVEHPLWDQGKWTMLARAQDIDRVFGQLAKSLASGELQKHGGIIALRARVLPFSESTYEIHASGPKRKKSFSGRRNSSRSPTSARYANDQPLGIDIYFKEVWSSSAARSVLQLVAEISGRMASFCKSSLYSCLGISSNHPLGIHAGLYQAKTISTLAEAKLWTNRHHVPDSSVRASSPNSEAETSITALPPTSSPDTQASVQEPIDTQPEKREVDSDEGDGHETAQKEPATKKARREEEAKSDADVSLAKKEVPASIAQESQLDTQDTQDEPMLPVRPVEVPTLAPGQAKVTTNLELAAKENSADSEQASPDNRLERTHTAGDSFTLLAQADVKAAVDESQTQIEPVGTRAKSVILEQQQPVQDMLIDNAKAEIGSVNHGDKGIEDFSPTLGDTSEQMPVVEEDNSSATAVVVIEAKKDNLQQEYREAEGRTANTSAAISEPDHANDEVVLVTEKGIEGQGVEGSANGTEEIFKQPVATTVSEQTPDGDAQKEPAMPMVSKSQPTAVPIEPAAKSASLPSASIRTTADQVSKDIAAHISEGIATIVEAAQAEGSVVTPANTGPEAGHVANETQSQQQEGEEAQGPAIENSSQQPGSQHHAAEMPLKDLIVEDAACSPNESARADNDK